jgi:hypothetical protein
MLIFLDTEFTNLLGPQLLSLGLVTNDAVEHYVELDMNSEIGRRRRKASSEFVRHEGVLHQWGTIEGAACSEWEMGRRTGEWLLDQAARAKAETGTQSAEMGTRVEIAFDYPTDFELLEEVIRESRLWDQVREVVRPVNVAKLVGTSAGELAAEEAFAKIRSRGLKRHHALADAWALRAAYLAVRQEYLSRWKDIR